MSGRSPQAIYSLTDISRFTSLRDIYLMGVSTWRGLSKNAVTSLSSSGLLIVKVVKLKNLK